MGEKVVATEDFLKEGSERTLHINRMMTTGVVEAPFGAHFTHCVPDYDRDEAFQKEYAETAKSPELWQAFVEKYIEKEPGARSEMLAKARAQGVQTSGIPVLDVYGTILPGLDRERLDVLLARQ